MKFKSGQEADAFYAAERNLIAAKEAKAAAEFEYQEARSYMLAVISNINGNDGPCKIISPSTGMVISRELRPANPSEHPVIDPVKLQNALSEEQWNLITDESRILNEEKLVSALDSNQIPQEVLQDAISYPDQKEFLVYREPSKEDKFAIEVEETKKKLA